MDQSKEKNSNNADGSGGCCPNEAASSEDFRRAGSFMDCDCFESMPFGERMKWFRIISQMYPEMMGCCMESLNNMGVKDNKDPRKWNIPEFMKFWTGSAKDVPSDEFTATISEVMDFMGACWGPREKKNEPMKMEPDKETINEENDDGATSTGGKRSNANVHSFPLEVECSHGRCPVGEITGERNIREGLIPVFSCEGACIRGEIARIAANMIGKEEGFARACHGETFTIPDSAIGRWVRNAEKVVLIDGCFLKCHSRILRGQISEDKLLEFDALSHYGKYSDIFDIDDVPEEERNAVAQDVVSWILGTLNSRKESMKRGSCCE